MTDINKLVQVTDKGIVVLDDKLMDKIKKKNLSASMVSSFFQCPADWLMDTFILREIEHEEPIYFERGHLFHESMEHFFALPGNERTPSALGKIATAIINKDYAHVKSNPETMEWLKTAMKNYFEMGFDYQNHNIAMVPQKVKKTKKELTAEAEEKGVDIETLDKYKTDEKIGLEIFVNGKLGNTTRKIVGVVDTVLDVGDGYYIEDWKTGKSIHPFDPEKEIGKDNDFGYWRQQILYTMLMEQAGHKVNGARLTFPVAKGVVEVDTNNEALREQVIKDFELLDASLNKCIEENLFPFKGHFFCKWCSMLHPSYRSRMKPHKVNKQELVQLVEFM